MQNRPKATVIFTFIVIAALTRALPHPPNFAPIAAMALFGGAYLSDKRLAYLLPMVAMLISDLVLEGMFQLGLRSFHGIHSGMIWVYLAFAGVVAIGHLLNGKVSLGKLVPAGLASSLLFFAVTNFGVWATGTMYPSTFDGLVACYTAAIPFFHYTLAGDVVYMAALFGGFALLRQSFPQLATVKA